MVLSESISFIISFRWAILLISAKDGVQAQTRILFHALRKMQFPQSLSIRLTKMELLLGLSGY